MKEWSKELFRVLTPKAFGLGGDGKCRRADFGPDLWSIIASRLALFHPLLFHPLPPSLLPGRFFSCSTGWHLETHKRLFAFPKKLGWVEGQEKLVGMMNAILTENMLFSRDRMLPRGN